MLGDKVELESREVRRYKFDAGDHERTLVYDIYHPANLYGTGGQVLVSAALFEWWLPILAAHAKTGMNAVLSQADTPC